MCNIHVSRDLHGKWFHMDCLNLPDKLILPISLESLKRHDIPLFPSSSLVTSVNVAVETKLRSSIPMSFTVNPATHPVALCVIVLENEYVN